MPAAAAMSPARRTTAATALVGLAVATAFVGLPSAKATGSDLLDVVSVNGTTSAAAAVSIVPLLSTGVTGSPIALPTAKSGTTWPLTLSGSATSEGALSLSGDGRYLTVAGYGAAPGTASVASTASTSVPRVAGRIDGSGNVDTTTALTDAMSGNNVRGAATNDGTRIWMTGAGSGSTVKAGMVTALLGATTSTAIVTSVSAARAAQVVGGNLYLSTDKTTPTGVSKVGTGLPTTASQSLSLLNGPADPYGFALLTLGGGSTPDTLYGADGTTGGITKYSLSGSTWTAKGTIASGTKLFGLTGKLSGTGAQLYATSLDGSKVYSLNDTSGAGATMTGSLTTIATAPTGTVYRGIAFGPSGQPVPGPSPVLTLGDSALGGVVSDPNNPVMTVTVSDSDSSVDLNAVTVTAATSNTSVAPAAGVSVSGTGTTRTVSVVPAGVGYSTITLTATDPLGRTGTVSFTYGASAAAPDATSHYLAGASDESTAQDVGGGYLLVGDDTTNALRLYRGDRSGLPVAIFDFSSQLGLGTSGSDSMDIEASARVGSTIYWLGSMGNSSDDGSLRPSRATLYATTVTGTGAATTLTFAGAYTGLRSDLLAWDQANGSPLGLTSSAAAGHLPKTIDGFNLEGMEFSTDGSTAYLGFRAPLENTTNRTVAVVIPVTNLPSLIAGSVHASIGTPLFWGLGGLSVREIRRNADGQYLVIAGSYAAGGSFALYSWDGNPAHQPVATTTVLPAPLGSWESIVATPDPLVNGSSVQLVEDDGSVDFYGDGSTTEAKTLALGLRKSRIDTFTISLPQQAISFTTTPPVPAVYGTSYQVAATGGASGQPVTFTASGGSCSLSGAASGVDGSGNGTGSATVTLTGAGSCTITADQAAGVGYQPATSVPQSFSVSPATPTITWPTPDPIVYGTALSATQLDATANVAGTFSYSPASGTVLHAGTSSLTATFTPTDATNYAPTSATVSLVVSQAPQAISFPSLPDRTFGDAAFTVTATGGGSGQPVVLSTGSPSVCTVSGTTVTIAGAGTCTLNASQNGSTDYAAAPVTPASFVVAKAAGTLSLAGVVGHTYGDAPFVVTPTGTGSSAPIVLHAAPASVCSVSSFTVTLAAGGSCTLTVDQAGDAHYLAAATLTAIVGAVAGPGDPTAPLALNGVGSDLLQGVLSQLSTDISNSGAGPTIGSWPAHGSPTFDTGRSGCSAVSRPTSAADGRAALSASLSAGDGCLQFVRSADGTASPGLTSVPFASDLVSYAVSANSSISRSLTLAQLQAIYHCDPAYVGTLGSPGALTPQLPRTGSELRAYWESEMGITDADVVGGVYPCIVDGVKAGQPIDEESATSLDQQSLIPFSIGQFLLESNGRSTDRRGTSVLGTIGGDQPTLVNGTFSSSREVYNVIPTNATGTAPYSSVFVGPGSLVCQDTATILRYGFALDPSCGSTAHHS